MQQTTTCARQKETYNTQYATSSMHHTHATYDPQNATHASHAKATRSSAQRTAAQRALRANLFHAVCCAQHRRERRVELEQVRPRVVAHADRAREIKVKRLRRCDDASTTRRRDDATTRRCATRPQRDNATMREATTRQRVHDATTRDASMTRQRDEIRDAPTTRQHDDARLVHDDEHSARRCVLALCLLCARPQRVVRGGGILRHPSPAKTVGARPLRVVPHEWAETGGSTALARSQCTEQKDASARSKTATKAPQRRTCYRSREKW